MKTAILAAAFAAFAAMPSYAAEILFTIVKLDGSEQPVTARDLKSVGEITLKTPLIGQEDQKDAIHDVTGARLRDVLKHFSVQGELLDAAAFDAYKIDIPVADARNYDVILATAIDGKKLTLRDRGPVWIVYPLKDNPELLNPMYEGRSVWQLKELRMR